MAWTDWKPCDDARATEVVAELASSLPWYFGGASLGSARETALRFYTRHVLVEVELLLARIDEPVTVYALHGPERPGGPPRTRWLNGTSAPIHDTNDLEELALTDTTVEDYLRYFLFFLRGDNGPFVPVESAEGIEAKDDAAEGDDAAEQLDLIVQRAAPLQLQDQRDAGDRWLFDAVLAYEGALFAAAVAVEGNGLVEMLDDEPLGFVDQLEVPGPPDLDLAIDNSVAVPVGPVDPTSGPGDDDRFDTDDIEAAFSAGVPLYADPEESGSISQRAIRRQAEGEPAAPRLRKDRQVTEAIVSVLLERALRDFRAEETKEKRLVPKFASSSDADPIGDLTKLARNEQLVVIIESNIPFVEEVVGALIDGERQIVSGGRIARASEVSGDEVRCAVSFDRTDVRLHLISFHAFVSLWAAERTANELSFSEATVLVGCDRASDVPEPLRRISDMTLTFPKIDPDQFATIFQRVFGQDPPTGWNAGGATWTSDLVPSDFHDPANRDADVETAFGALRERALDRIAKMSADSGPGLDDLHGLGEAMQIARDLVDDIRSAKDDPALWSAVDGGLLLTGAPGTGKTSLARALAKESGLPFVAASAASWQAAGALDAHLRAMRADFATARRHSPAILFLDEIDSIGTREGLDDRNSVYQTDVINALLEQMQGLDPANPVVVIAATNYPDRVDPALRRAGRLDQVVTIPLPNAAGLTKIFEFHLGPYQTAGQVDPGVDLRTLAELCLGRTGADVKFFVRGAFRRSRRAGRTTIQQEDLLAEVTSRPRDPASAPHLDRAALRRVAVHEAGHALASLTSSGRGDDLTFITVIPRLDGSLGFVASAPGEDDLVHTRATLLERLEQTLAGRAAEEVVFGADDVGSGAGGADPSSDLAVATRIATLIVCQAGLGGDGSLYWTERPTTDQVDEIRSVLASAYRSVVERIRAHQRLHERIVAELEVHQELSGSALRALRDEEA